jgi:isomerase DpgB
MVTRALRIDGAQPVTFQTVAELDTLCDEVEDDAGPGVVAVRVGGAPPANWSRRLTVALVTKWERTLRRFERLPMTTVAVAGGDCGGTALEVLLATDFRIATADTRILVPVEDGVPWPSMALYRLTQQAGTGHIRQAALFGTAVTGPDALAARLVDEVTSDPEEALARAAAALGPFSGPDLAIRRQLVANAAVRGFEDVLGMHLAACDRALRRTRTAEATA